MRASEYVVESFVNLVGSNPLKDKFRDQVWDLLQSSYTSIGGISGSGFETKDKILNIPFWKIVVKDQVIRAVVMYKDTNGRKAVAIGSDGSPYARDALENVMRMDLDRSYGEKSKAALGFIMKTVSWDILSQYVIEPEQAGQILGKQIMPVTDLPEEDWPLDAQHSIHRYPILRDYGYLRLVGNNFLFKVMFGSPGKSIY